MLAEHGAAQPLAGWLVAGGAGAAPASGGAGGTTASRAASRPPTSPSSAEQDILGDPLLAAAGRQTLGEFRRRGDEPSTPAISWCMSTTASAASSSCRTSRAAGAPHDCLEINYAEGAKLYLPVEEHRASSRHCYGSMDIGVELDRLGGTGWQTRQARLKNRIREIAHELIKIAAERLLRDATKLVMETGASGRIRSGLSLRGNRRPADRNRRDP